MFKVCQGGGGGYSIISKLVKKCADVFVQCTVCISVVGQHVMAVRFLLSTEGVYTIPNVYIYSVG